MSARVLPLVAGLFLLTACTSGGNAPTVTATSPVDTAARMARPGCSSATDAASSSPVRTARSASSSWATGVPHTATTASPMNFSIVPPWRPTTVVASSK